MKKKYLSGDIDIYNRELEIAQVLSYTDAAREGKRIGLVREEAEASSELIKIWSLSKSQKEDSWVPDGRKKTILRKDIICLHYPKILGKNNLVS